MTRALFEPIRSLAFGSISGTYAAVGDALDNPARLVLFSNNTEGDMFFSTNGTDDHIFVAAGSFVLIDVCSNMKFVNEDKLEIVQGTQFYVKQITAPVSGDVYITVMYAR